MWHLNYKGFRIQGQFLHTEVEVIHPKTFKVWKKKSLHAAKIFITKRLRAYTLESHFIT